MLGLSLSAGAVAARARAGGPPPAPAPISAVDANGWSAQWAGGVPPTFQPDTAPQLIAVSRQGFDATGAATVHPAARTFTKRVRRPFPDQGAFTPSTVSLDDYLYATDAVAGAANGSAEASPKPVANWALPDRTLVGDSVVVEVVAFHRDGIACVKVRATDGTAAAPVVTVAAPVVSPEAGDRNAVLAYRATLDLTGLAAGANVTVNAEVFPRVGGTASVLDSAAQSTPRAFSPRLYVKKPTLYLHVGPTGSDATTGASAAYVGTDPAEAAAKPALTVTGALNRAKTFLGAAAGSLDGLRIRLAAGTHVLTATPGANVVAAAVVVEPAPGVARAECVYEFGAANVSPNVTHLRLRDLTVRRMGSNVCFSGTGSLTLDGVDYQPNGFSGAFGTAAFGVAVVGGSSFASLGAALSASTPEIRLVRGLDAGTMGLQSAVEAWLLLGNTLRGVQCVRGARSASGSITAFNRLLGIGGANPVLEASDSTGLVDGAAVVQNVLEWTATNNNTSLRASADGSPSDTRHVILWHNTITGHDFCGRSNLFYDDSAGDPRSHRLQSCVGNVHSQMNTKHDVFMSDGARTGGWAYLHGVGCRAEFSRFRDAGGATPWRQDYPGLRARIGTGNAVAQDPLFTDYRGTAAGPTAGAGGGTYTLQPGSPARGMVPAAVLPFDLAGVPRPATGDAAGAYT